jgi:GTPase SAR1 family protein
MASAFTVALIGPDGVGKTTIARRLEREFPLPLKYLYMGDNVEACNVMLPTTRWWKRRQRRPHPGQPQKQAGSRGGRARLLAGPLHATRKTLGFVNRVLDEMYREMVAASYSRRGTVVLFDRHFILDYYHGDIDPTARRIMQDFWGPNNPGDDASGSNNFKSSYPWPMKNANFSTIKPNCSYPRRPVR